MLCNQSSNPLPPHLPLRIPHLLLHGHSGPQNKRGPSSYGSGTETAGFKLFRAEQTSTSVQAFQKIRCIHSLYPHPGAFQLLSANAHSNAHFQPVPPIHRKVAGAYTHTGGRSRRNQQILPHWQTQRLQRHPGHTSPVRSHHERDKRFLDLVALGMSAAALTLSTFNSARILTLETQILNNNKRFDHLVDITSLHENHFWAVDKKLDNVADKLATLIKINKVYFPKMTDFMEQKFSTAVAISERRIHMAYNNWLAPGALHHEALTEIVKHVNEIPQNSDLLSFVHQPSDLFLVETSYIYKLDKFFCSGAPHPSGHSTQLMLLYEFTPLPVHFNFSGNISVTPELGFANMIAVWHSQLYQLLSSMDLQSCNKMGETYFCKGRNVLLTDLTKTCLGALYFADAKNIQGQCKFSIGGAQEKIFCLDSNTYVVKINTNHVCPKAKSILAVQISSGQTVRINPSCYIRTMDHIITADDSEEIKIHSKWLDWTWTLGQLFQQPENKMVTTAINKLRTKISRKFDPSRTWDHDQGGQGVCQGGTHQPLDLHHPGGHDRQNLGLPFLPFLLLENLPELQPSCNSSPISVTSSGSANRFQHDRQSDSQMKTQNHYLKTIWSYFV